PTSGATTGSTPSTRSSTPVRRNPIRRTTPPRTPPPVRRGITAEQYNAQGDEFFKAENYDDALEAYQKAVALKPIAGAYYHIGWIYNDRDDFDNALRALQQSARLNLSESVYFNELGYAYKNVKQYSAAISAYRRAIQIRSDYA